MLEIKNITKTFNPGTVNEKIALGGLNLSLKEGDFVTVCIDGLIDGDLSGYIVEE